MTEFVYDHVHLRSPDPEATAAFYQKMFGAKVIKSVMSNGIERTDMEVGGVAIFIAQVPEDAPLSEKPEHSFVGLDHLGLRVKNIDVACRKGWAAAEEARPAGAGADEAASLAGKCART